MGNEQKAVQSQFRIIDGKSEQLFNRLSFEKNVDVQEELDSLLRHPKNINMPCVFILDSDKIHRDEVVDEWISRNKISINMRPYEPYSLAPSEENELRIAADIRIGTEPTLLRSMQSTISCYPENLQRPNKTLSDCATAIVYPIKIWSEYHPIFIVRDIENLLNLKRKKDGELFVNFLKNYYNDLHCSFVFTGTVEGAHALNITEQFGWRFLNNVLDFDYSKQV